MKTTPSTVVHIITKLELGGAQKVCLSLVQGLAKNGMHTYLITGNKGTLVQKAQNLSNIFLLPTFKREIAISQIFLELRNFFAIVQILRKLKKKHPKLIVHTHSTKAGLVGRWAAWCVGIKKRVHTIHGYGFNAHQSWFSWLMIYLLELITSCITTHYVCVSSEDVKIGIRLFPRFAKKHSIIRAAIDWHQFYLPARIHHNQPHPAQPFVFGTVSSFTQPGKNIPDLLRAFEWVHAHHPDVRLEIIGGGILKKNAEEWIAAHPDLHEKIVLHGWQEQVAPLMLNWHAFVFTSLWEGLPCAIVEARMLKLPVLSYNTGGIHDVIIHEKNGLLYPQKNWQQLAQGMLSLTTQPQLYKQLKNYPDDLKYFNDATMIKQHRKLYKII